MRVQEIRNEPESLSKRNEGIRLLRGSRLASNVHTRTLRRGLTWVHATLRHVFDDRSGFSATFFLQGTLMLFKQS